MGPQQQAHGTPPSAGSGGGRLNPREVVDRYVARANAGDLEALLGLFARDAVVEHLVGRFEGLEAIRGFYRDVILPTNPQVSVADYEERADGCRVVFEATTDAVPAQVLRVVDRLLLDADGRIAHLHITVESGLP